MMPVSKCRPIDIAVCCQILRLNCTKVDVGCGFAPDPTERAYSAPPDPVAGFKGPTSRGREGRAKERRRGEGRGGDGAIFSPQIFLSSRRFCVTEG